MKPFREVRICVCLNIRREFEYHCEEKSPMLWSEDINNTENNEL